MKKVLIISPYFPPLNAADMQRIRLSLPYYKEFGWEPVVLTVDSGYMEDIVKDELLLKTVPLDTEIHKVKAVSGKLTKHIGINNASIRAIPYLYKKGLKIIKKNEISLVFFSTTSFHTMFLGRLWKNKTMVPYLIDMQDPWFSDIDYRDNFRNVFKFRINREIHKRLEAWAMKKVDGLISVSDAYIDTLITRYQFLKNRPSKTITFGASDIDFEVLKNNPQKNRFFSKDSSQISGVYIGRAGKDMETSLSIIFNALQIGLKENPEKFKKIKLYFIGTDYAPSKLAKKMVEPVAKKYGVTDYVYEFPERIPYFESLQIIKDSDFLIVSGSDEPQYSASKIYPYIMAKKPMISVFHKESPIIKILKELKSANVVGFLPNEDIEEYSNDLYMNWNNLLESIPFIPQTDWEAFKKYTAKALTLEQCRLFDEVIKCA
ncbi:MAG: hypothetical protein ACRENO_09390 [Thermodesulfobacteriota bacterium]